MPDVFVSYSREDLPFVERLVELLDREELEVWVDLEGLYAGEEFWPEIQKAIDAAPVLIFVISPESVASRFCGMELDHAVARTKRVLPVCHRRVDDAELHPELAKHQWLFLDEDGAAAGRALVAAIRADWAWLRGHARLLVRAREWEDGGHDASLVLRGRELRQAEEWLARGGSEERAPTPLHRRFLEASREAARRRRLRLGGAVAASLAGFALLGWFGLAARVASLNNLALDDVNRGQAEAAVTRLHRADAICERLGGLMNACGDVGLTLGRAYLESGRHALALERFDRALTGSEGAGVTDPGLADYLGTAHQNRAFAHIMLAEEQDDPQARSQRYAEAESDLESAIGLFERTESGLAGKPVAITRSRILLGRGDYAASIEELERAGRMSNAPDVDLLLAAAYRCSGNPLRSLRHFKKYITDLEYQDQDPHWLRYRDYYERLTQRCSIDSS